MKHSEGLWFQAVHDGQPCSVRLIPISSGPEAREFRRECDEAAFGARVDVGCGVAIERRRPAALEFRRECDEAAFGARVDVGCGAAIERRRPAALVGGSQIWYSSQKTGHPAALPSQPLHSAGLVGGAAAACRA
jgi:hypothetical protein